MHLGYHELRNMLNKFREEREKRKAGPPAAAAPASMVAPGAPARSGGERGGDYRSSRDDYRERERDRDRGYDRHSSRYEYVLVQLFRPSIEELSVVIVDGIGSGQGLLGGGISRIPRLLSTAESSNIY